MFQFIWLLRVKTRSGQDPTIALIFPVHPWYRKFTAIQRDAFRVAGHSTNPPTTFPHGPFPAPATCLLSPYPLPWTCISHEGATSLLSSWSLPFCPALAGVRSQPATFLSFCISIIEPLLNKSQSVNWGTKRRWHFSKQVCIQTYFHFRGPKIVELFKLWLWVSTMVSCGAIILNHRPNPPCI